MTEGGRRDAVQLRGVDDRPLVLRAAGARGRGGRLSLDGDTGQHLLSAGRQQRVPVQPGRQPRVPRGQAVPRAVLADPGAGRGDQPDPVHHVRHQGAGPQPGAAGQAGDIDGGAHRQPAGPRRGNQPVARGLRHPRRGLGQPRAAAGRVDRHPARAGRRRVLRVSTARPSTLPPVKIAPVPTEPIPVLIGGHSDAALRRAARLGDGWMHGGGDPADLPRLLARLAEFRAGRTGGAAVPPDSRCT